MHVTITNGFDWVSVNIYVRAELCLCVEMGGGGACIIDLYRASPLDSCFSG